MRICFYEHFGALCMIVLQLFVIFISTLKVMAQERLSNDISSNKRSIKQMVKKYTPFIFLACFGIIVGACITYGINFREIHLLSHQNHDSYKNDDYLTRYIFKNIDKKSLGKYLKWLSSKPHDATSQRDEEIANWIASSFKTLDSVSIQSFDVLLSYVDYSNPSKVEGIDESGNIMFSSRQSFSTGGEYSFADKSLDQIAYSAEKSIESGSLVYVNYAQKKDFDKLKALGVGTSDRIAIARLGRVSIGRKILNCQNHEIRGLIIYDDPEDAAPEGEGKVYPQASWLPENGVRSGSGLVIGDGGQGDPLTPGWPSIEGAVKLNVNYVSKLPLIPVHSVSYKVAKNIISRLGGKNSPSDWMGGLRGIGYKLGGEFLPSEDLKRIRLEVHSKLKISQIKNVVGVIRGYLEPDRYVIFGNHRDAWGFGNIDPATGTAAMVKMVQSFSKAMKDYNWRPRRTIIFVSWAAKEFGLVGSTEWVEENLKILFNRAVAYVNVDSCSFGSILSTKSSPGMLKMLSFSARRLKDMNDPSKNYYDSLKQTKLNDDEDWFSPEMSDKHTFFSEEDHINQRRNIPEEEDDGFFSKYMEDISAYRENEMNSDVYEENQKEHLSRLLGTEGDYYPFAFISGIPAVDIKFTNNKKYTSLLRSQYDDFSIYQRVIDPKFKILQFCSRYISDVVRRLADSILLPFDPVEYFNVLKHGIEEIRSNHSLIRVLNNHGISLEHLVQSSRDLELVSKNWTSRLKDFDFNSNPIHARIINDQIMEYSRLFLSHDPIRNTTTNILFGPGDDPSLSYPLPRLKTLVSNLYYKYMDTDDAIVDDNTQDEDEDIFNVKKHITDLLVTVKAATKQLVDFTVLK